MTKPDLDAVKVDPEHYEVVCESDRVRVLRISYGPGDVARMHAHPDSVLVFLADGAVRFTFPDGETEDFHFRAGEAVLMPATSHAAENLGDSPFQLFQIEVKD